MNNLNNNKRTHTHTHRQYEINCAQSHTLCIYEHICSIYYVFYNGKVYSMYVCT